MDIYLSLPVLSMKKPNTKSMGLKSAFGNKNRAKYTPYFNFIAERLSVGYERL